MSQNKCLTCGKEIAGDRKYCKNCTRFKSYKQQSSEYILQRERNKKINRELHEEHLKAKAVREQQEKSECKYRLQNSKTNRKIRTALSGRLNIALKRNRKGGHLVDLLGCNIDNFRQYLESKFTKGMNWENHDVNGWHIDHIEPCCSFDLSQTEEQRKCFHYTNLRPLWAKENWKKRSKDLTKRKSHAILIVER